MAIRRGRRHHLQQHALKTLLPVHKFLTRGKANFRLILDKCAFDHLLNLRNISLNYYFIPDYYGQSCSANGSLLLGYLQRDARYRFH